ncbi:IS701 family transposase [Streptomyces sp. NPDC001220]
MSSRDPVGTRDSSSVGPRDESRGKETRPHREIRGRWLRRRTEEDRVSERLSDLGRKNGWTMAGRAGHATPHRIQRFLGEASWSADGLPAEVQAYAARELGDPGATLVLDDTQVIKKGDKSVGVGHQHCGTTGDVRNCQVMVMLTHAAASGHTCYDRRLYLPQSWTGDRERCREAGVPDEAAFATKPQLGIAMLQGAVAGGLPFSWVAADADYGKDPALRSWLRHRAPPPTPGQRPGTAAGPGIRRGRCRRPPPSGHPRGGQEISSAHSACPHGRGQPLSKPRRDDRLQQPDRVTGGRLVAFVVGHHRASASSDTICDAGWQRPTEGRLARSGRPDQQHRGRLVQARHRAVADPVLSRLACRHRCAHLLGHRSGHVRLARRDAIAARAGPTELSTTRKGMVMLVHSPENG